MDDIALFRLRAAAIERRIPHEAEHGWSGPLDFMIRGPLPD
ncbi:hypothetical protein [Sphingomonas sp.]|nr:hypothetical protein [Sphingomonas sp.]